MTQKQKTDIYEEIKRRLITALNPDAIYVFGSFARNTETANSDIDVLIEKETALRFQKRTSEARKLLKGLPFPFDVLVYTPQEIRGKLNDKYSAVYQAMSAGVKIYEKHT
ncbi:MAG: nucleotidyltransferase domain-containing protein [bacterium]